MAFLAAALPALADLGATGATAAAGTGLATDAAATAAAAAPEALGADALTTTLTSGAIPSVGDILSMSGASSEGITGAVGSAPNSLPSADTLKSFANGSGTDISDILKAFTGQQAAKQPSQATPPLSPRKGGSQSIAVPPLISAQMANPISVFSKLGPVGSGNNQLSQLLKALLSGQQSAIG